MITGFKRSFRTGSMLIALAALASSAMAQDQGRGLANMKLDGNQPIAIDADKLEVREAEGVAVFSGAVEVSQGKTNLKAGRLDVYYAKGGEGSVATGSANIERLVMSGKVVIRSEAQTATGDAGSFDMRSEVFVLTGERVVLTEGQNVAVGCKLTVQMATGEANLESCPSTGRVQIMLNPKSAQRQRNGN